MRLVFAEVSLDGVHDSVHLINDFFHNNEFFDIVILFVIDANIRNFIDRAEFKSLTSAFMLC